MTGIKKGLSVVAFVALFSLSAAAHFVFVVPQSGTSEAFVFVSETLQPDARVDAFIAAEATLSLRDLQGTETALPVAKGPRALTVALPAGARGVIHGLADFGVSARGKVANLLVYHPKTIVGDAFDVRMTVGGDTPAELVPTGRAGALRFRLVVRGQPAAGMEVTVIQPDGTETLVKTGPDGLTEAFAAPGRYGAWARSWEKAPGTHNGKPFAEVHHYATLVLDVPASMAAGPAGRERSAVRIATMPEATSSFGAVASDGGLYVFGGHIVPTHSYSTEAVSGRFHRHELPDGATRESLPEDTVSVADVARFDPSSRRWDALPPLPAPRSSHDVVVVGDTLYAIGGWNMHGKTGGNDWFEQMALLDLTAATPAWTSLPQPFKRRAYIAATHDTRIFVIGGFDEHNKIVRGMDVYDVATQSWSVGPVLSGGAMNGFGAAAAVSNGRLFISLGDGTLHRLSADGGAWEPAGRATPRIVHRMVADGHRLLIAGGAARGANSDLVEVFDLER